MKFECSREELLAWDKLYEFQGDRNLAYQLFGILKFQLTGGGWWKNFQDAFNIPETGGTYTRGWLGEDQNALRANKISQGCNPEDY